MMKPLLATLIAVFSAGTTMAAEPSIAAVNSQSCHLVKGTQKPFILVLKKGEKLVENIVKCANEAQLSGAMLSGLGAIEKTTLTYFDHEAKTYQKKEYPQFLELVSLNGNINEVDGKRQTHIHVALSDDQYQMVGGHLAEAEVAATAEINIVPLPGKLKKTYDEKVGLDLIETPKST